jgi:uncharacterized protein (DUF2249 family)
MTISEIFGQSLTPGRAEGTDMPEIDVRDIPPKNRHPKIMDTFEGMDAGETLTLINDHDPKPLFYEMQAEREQFDVDGYEVTQEGEERFVAKFPKE